jgi:NDP-sugar pyrophosphorylase family protein
MVGMTILRAMLLAAGRGTRLRPLTNTTPKPLLPVGDQRLIDFPLGVLRDGGITDVVINLHHLGDQIRNYVGDGSRWTLQVQYSEEPEILGTGGGMRHAASLLGDDPFVVLNADIIIDIDLRDVIATHANHPDTVATLVRPLGGNDPHTPLAIAADGRLTGIIKAHHPPSPSSQQTPTHQHTNISTQCHYTGCMIGTRALIDQLPPTGPSCLVKNGLQPLLDAGAYIATHYHAGPWTDVGTPKRYAAAQI